MIYLLLLQATLGWALVGQFDNEDECEAHAIMYMAMLREQKSDDKHNVKMACMGVPRAFPEPHEMHDI